MSQRNYYGLLIVILLLAAAVIWVDLPNNPGIHIGNFNRSLKTSEGLDLKGGLQVLLEADLPATTEIDPQSLRDARQILENRSNALGVGEVNFQVAGNRRIVAEFPGLTNTEDVLAVLKQTGQLEFVDMGTSPLSVGTVIKTDLGTSSSTTPSTTATAGTPSATTPEATSSISASGTPENTSSTPASTEAAAAAGTPSSTETAATPAATGTAESPENKVWHTVMTGDQLDTVGVVPGTVSGFEINFTLKSTGKQVFSEYTSAHVGDYLAIVLDKKIISTPRVDSAITQGSGVIQGTFTQESANNLAVQLRYGSLPIPLKIAETRLVGATLGSDSIRKSILAGIIGLLVVVLFMGIYYRLPGVLADLALILYTGTTFALYRLIPVTLTLPGIAGFVLSIGVAVDANVLIFERLKEELRAGRTLRQAIDLGWQRAWPSIRDSNISTLITCAILYWFGTAYGASLVKGFALTLALGVCVSLFTAIVVTRTFLHVVLDNLKFPEHPRWFGA